MRALRKSESPDTGNHIRLLGIEAQNHYKSVLEEGGKLYEIN